MMKFEALVGVKAPNLLNRSLFKSTSSPSLRAFSTSDFSNQSRGALPRFFSEVLPTSKDDRSPKIKLASTLRKLGLGWLPPSAGSDQGGVVCLQGDEVWHMTKVLRLGVNDRVELFNGKGGLVEGCIQRIDRMGVEFVALGNPRLFHPFGTQWHVYAAFGTLKGGRSDWLVEKCTELGACSITPLLTERSPSMSVNRVERLQRVTLAGSKQCQRLHEMTLNPPVEVSSILPMVGQLKLSFIAVAEATPLINVLASSAKEASGSLIVGPEGDFTENELRMITKAGATPVGLGPHRLRVETATLALLATAMLWSDSLEPSNS